MKEKIIVGIIIIGMISISGCTTPETESKPILEEHSQDIYYSDDNETILLHCEFQNADNLVNIIDKLYDEGYEYVGDTQKAWNNVGRVDFFLIFRLIER